MEGKAKQENCLHTVTELTLVQVEENLIITKAAIRAGAYHVQLVYEPQCAAAYFTEKVKKGVPKWFVIGDTLLIADLGGGTGDFVLYRFVEDSTAGAKITLRLISSRGQYISTVRLDVTEKTDL